MVSALNVAAVMVRSTGDSGCTIQELAGLVWNKRTAIFQSARACCSYEMWYDCKWLECSRPMAVSASPAARAVRTACFAEQMEQKKQLLLASSQKSYPPAFHSLYMQKMCLVLWGRWVGEDIYHSLCPKRLRKLGSVSRFVV